MVLCHTAVALVALGLWSEVQAWEETVTTQLQPGVMTGMAM